MYPLIIGGLVVLGLVLAAIDLAFRRWLVRRPPQAEAETRADTPRPRGVSVVVVKRIPVR